MLPGYHLIEVVTGHYVISLFDRRTPESSNRLLRLVIYQAQATLGSTTKIWKNSVQSHAATHERCLGVFFGISFGDLVGLGARQLFISILILYTHSLHFITRIRARTSKQSGIDGSLSLLVNIALLRFLIHVGLLFFAFDLLQ